MSAREYSKEELNSIAALFSPEVFNPSIEDLISLGLREENDDLYWTRREQEDFNMEVEKAFEVPLRTQVEEIIKTYKKSPIFPQSFLSQYKKTHAYACPGKSCPCQTTIRRVIISSIAGSFGLPAQWTMPLNK